MIYNNQLFTSYIISIEYGFLASIGDIIERFVIFDLNLIVLAIAAVSFGIVWLGVNFYHFYPYVQLFLIPVVKRERSGTAMYVPEIDENQLPSDPDEIPTFDILLPAYKENEVIHQPIKSIRGANYPQEKIQVHVILEPDDEKTPHALNELKEYEFNRIEVPEQYPGEPNKPRALNYAFEQSDGDIVGIIDAEDIVDPDLFLHCYSALILESKDYVQGILDMVNEHDGWKNLLFRAEYAWWFRWLLPAFHYVDYPVPLGGTTNFVHRSVLKDMSELRHKEYGPPWGKEEREWFSTKGLAGSIPWDPRNVTEDFELGLFLWKEGYDLGLMNVVTKEESPLNWNAWIRQRTRWQKGKIYSFVQYANTMPHGIRSKFHLLFQSLLPHLAPVNVAGIVLLAMIANLLGFEMPIGAFIVLVLGLVFLLIMNVLHAFSYWRASGGSIIFRVIRTLIVLLTVQLYWLPLWGAEHRALKQVYTDQLHWEKTTHLGRNGDTLDTDLREGLSERQKVLIGLLFFLVGMLITWLLPLFVVQYF